MTKWDYHLEPMAEHATPDDHMLKRMRELGQDGWEMFDHYPSPHVLLFRRPVRD